MGYTVITSQPANFDHTGWCEHTGRTDHELLKAFVKSIHETTGISGMQYTQADCMEAAKYKTWKSGHYIDTALYIGEHITKILKAIK